MPRRVNYRQVTPTELPNRPRHVYYRQVTPTELRTHRRAAGRCRYFGYMLQAPYSDSYIEAIVNLIARILHLPSRTFDAKRLSRSGAGTTNEPATFFGYRRSLRLPSSVLTALLAFGLIAVAPKTVARSSATIPQSAAQPATQSASHQKQPEKLSAEEFARLVRELSEEGGFFRSDNFTSNETSYLHVIGKLRQLEATGGAYIGVGPEQNFTYIAKIRPRIAFIVDIRRQAMIQHLMFKAIFELSPARDQYLSLLLCRPLSKGKTPRADAPVNDILTAISEAATDTRTLEANLTAIRKEIREKFKIQLTEADQSGLEYVYRSFRADGLEIGYRVDGRRADWFPTLRELILQSDQNGKLGNFLASKEDYEFVRDLHRRNMIIPVVGDFGGKKALASVGDYLRKTGFTVTAFYVSNVEQYLFQGLVFSDFAENVRKLPINDHSLFIRAYPNQRYMHPARIGGHMITTLLQHISVFLRDFDEGRYLSYYDLVSTHYIAGEGGIQ